jgi:glycosyltransferase involved in cell wall biosynthesis
VDVNRFASTGFPPGPPTFLLIARLLSEKGLREYAAAARLVKERHPETVCQLVGPLDPSPDGITLEEINQWNESGDIQYLGDTADVRPFIAGCHIYVLPSYHEGMPRTILEAMAMGRPILTTDVPGCRETVQPGINGYLVPRCDANALAERMQWFIEHPDQWERMGHASRRIAEERFDVRRINEEMLQIMFPVRD